MECDRSAASGHDETAPSKPEPNGPQSALRAKRCQSREREAVYSSEMIRFEAGVLSSGRGLRRLPIPPGTWVYLVYK